MKMNKSQMLLAIESAKKIHLEQMDKIQSALNEKEVEHPTPLNKMQCDCGVWFYENEAILKDILGAQLFERLEKHHDDWHREYEKIYAVLFQQDNAQGFFAKLLQSKTKDSLVLDKARVYFCDLQKKSEILLHVSESAIRRVAALSESKFEKDL